MPRTATGRVAVLAMSISQLVRCSFGIKLHPKQKRFDDSCISFCVGNTYKQAADLSGFKNFFFKSNRKKIQIKSQIKLRSFESNLYSSNRISKCAQIVI